MPTILGVISDTHGMTSRTLEAARLFESLAVDAVVHCGDVGDEEVVRALRGWPAHYVFGNVDSPPSLRAAIQRAGKTCHERFGEMEREGRRIAFLHGDDARLLQETIASGRYDLVCHGHTHVARLEQLGPTLVLNPGAVYRSARPSAAIVQLPELAVTPITLGLHA